MEFHVRYHANYHVHYHADPCKLVAYSDAVGMDSLISDWWSRVIYTCYIYLHEQVITQIKIVIRILKLR